MLKTCMENQKNSKQPSIGNRVQVVKKKGGGYEAKKHKVGPSCDLAYHAKDIRLSILRYE